MSKNIRKFDDVYTCCFKKMEMDSEEFSDSDICTDPLPRSGHIAVIYGRYMIIWGGYCDDPYDWYLPARDFWIYDTEFKTWDVLQVEVTSPPGLSGSTASIHGDDLYLFAGHGRQGNINDLYHFNLRKREWELLSSYKEEYSNPSPRDKAVSWIYNNKFYCFGGFGPPLQGFLSENGKFTSDDSSYPTRGWNNQLLEYDISKKKWSNPKCIGEAPCPRAAHAAAQVRNKVYIFGGRYQTERLNDLHCVEVDNLHWSGRLTTEGNIPEGRSWHSLSALDDVRLFMYGGFNTSCQPLSDAWTLDLLTLQWSQLKHVPGDRPRLWHTACVTPSQEVVIHGGCSNNILDYQVQTEHRSDVIHIQTQPYSLLRICLDCVFAYRDRTISEWDSLPVNLSLHLKKQKEATEYLANSMLARGEHDEDNPSGATCAVS